MLRTVAIFSFLLTVGVLAINGNLVDDLGDCPPDLPRTQFVKSYNDVCLYLITGKHSWNDANSNCHIHGGQLVHIKDQDKQGFIVDTLTSMHWGDWGVWIGATDHDREGTWKWTDGTKLSYGNWHPGEGPAHGFLFSAAATEDCALLRLNDNGRWHDYNCGTILYHHTSICEYQKVYRPTTLTITTASMPTTTAVIGPPKSPMPSTTTAMQPPRTPMPTTTATETNALTTRMPTTSIQSMTTTTFEPTTTRMPTTTTTQMTTTLIKTTQTPAPTTTFGGIKIDFGTTLQAKKRNIVVIDTIDDALANRNTDSSGTSTGVNTGTYIAIGAGSCGVVVLVAAILTLVLRRRKRQSVAKTYDHTTSTNGNPMYDIMHGNGHVPENSFA